MNVKKVKNELQVILSGKSSASYDAVIQTVTGQLRTSQRTSPMAEEKHQNKEEETKQLTCIIHQEIWLWARRPGNGGGNVTEYVEQTIFGKTQPTSKFRST